MYLSQLSTNKASEYTKELTPFFISSPAYLNLVIAPMMVVKRPKHV
jgi:hypothetical protein